MGSELYNMYIISVGRRIFNVKIYQEVYYEKKKFGSFADYGNGLFYAGRMRIIKPDGQCL